MNKIYGTTILCVRRNNEVVIGGDGQATIGHTIAKNNIIKVRKIKKHNVITGFAGSTSDAFTLFEKFENKLDEYSGNLERSSVEMVKEWRMDRMLNKLEAMMIVANKYTSLLISGSGDVMSAENNQKEILSIGSGSNYAQSAAHALINNTELSAKEIVIKSLNIAADICIYTNKNLTIELINSKE